MKYKFFETQSGKKIKTAEFDGSIIADRLLEDVMFQVTIQDDGTLKISVKEEDEDYFEQFNTVKFLKEAQEYAENGGELYEPGTGEECWFESSEIATVEDMPVDMGTFANMMAAMNERMAAAPVSTPLKPSPIAVKATSGAASISTSGISPVGKNGIEMDGIPQDVQDIIKRAGSVYQVGGNGGKMTLGVGSNGEFEMDTDLEEVSVEPAKPKVLGKYTTKTIIHDFIGTIGNINLMSKTAQIKGKYFDSLNLEGIEFKMTLCDDNTFDFEEVVMDGGASVCTEEDIKRYIRAFDDCNVIGYRNKSVIPDMTFTATHLIREKEIQVDSYLVIDPKKPYDDLLNIMDDEKEIVVAEIDEEDYAQKMSMLFDDEPEVIEPPVPVLKEKEPIPMTTNGQLAEEFVEAKKEKREILLTKMKAIEGEYKVAKNSLHMASNKVAECDAEIKLLASRIDSLEINEPFNGYFFYIPEFISEASFLSDEVKTQIITKLNVMNYHNTAGFMKLFENSLYKMRFGLEVDGQITELTDYKNVYPLLKDIDLANEAKVYVGEDKCIYYEGQIEWSHLNNKLIRMGFMNDHRFEELCNYVPPVEDSDMDEEDDEEGYNNKYKNDDFIFGIYEDSLASNELGEPQYVIYVSPKSYFEKTGYMYDQHTHDLLKIKYPVIAQMGELIGEEIESGYTLYDSLYSETTKHVDNLDSTVDLFCKAGLKFKPSFQDMTENALGMKITDKIIEAINRTGNAASIVA